jgi:uncharacterized protein with ParB-like and HNH nuclease domain
MIEKELENKILELRSELKTDRLDMSFGEIMNIYEDGDLTISPEYQRSYRWDNNQKTRFVESILLGIPVPPIFVAEDDNGKWELVDGLQRISTILSFFGLLKDDCDRKNYFKLGETDLTSNLLNAIDINHLPSKLKLTIKRAVCRIEILRWDSKFDMRYELFNRLNTGSSPLTEQEIRNCVFTGNFNNLLVELAKYENFIKIIKPTNKQKEQMYLEEMVLRYFAVKANYNELYITKDIKLYLTSFMEDVNLSKVTFDYQKEKDDFLMIVDFLANNKFTKPFKGKNGAFSPSIYETIMILVFKFVSKYSDTNISKFKDIKNKLLKDDDFRKYAGDKTSQKVRLRKKLERAEEILND